MWQSMRPSELTLRTKRSLHQFWNLPASGQDRNFQIVDPQNYFIHAIDFSRFLVSENFWMIVVLQCWNLVTPLVTLFWKSIPRLNLLWSTLFFSGDIVSKKTYEFKFVYICKHCTIFHRVLLYSIKQIINSL